MDLCDRVQQGKDILRTIADILKKQDEVRKLLSELEMIGHLYINGIDPQNVKRIYPKRSYPDRSPSSSSK